MQKDMQKKIDNLLGDIKKFGISKPLIIVEQITYLLFCRMLDEIEIKHEERLKTENKPRRALFFAKDQQHLRWNVFSQNKDNDIITLINKEVLPFLRELSFRDDTNFSKETVDILRLFQGAHYAIHDPRLLAHLIDFISTIDFKNSEENGSMYQYLLTNANPIDKTKGMRTPQHIVNTMVQMLSPSQGEVVADPACGSGSFLVESLTYHASNNQYCTNISSKENIFSELFSNAHGTPQHSIYGFDINPTQALFATMNMLLYGNVSRSIFLQDTLSDSFNSCFSHNSSEFCDVVFSNPPFGMKLNMDNVSKSLLSTLKSSQPEILFFIRILDMLKDQGRAAIIVPEKFVFSNSLQYISLRQKLLDENTLDAIVSLPNGVFYPQTQIKTNILLLRKGGKSKDIFFFDVQPDGFSPRTNRQTMDANDIPNLLEVWEKRKHMSLDEHVKTYSEKTQNAFYVTADDIRKAEYNFSLDRYKESLPVERKSPQAIFEQIEFLQNDIQSSMKELKEVF